MSISLNFPSSIPNKNFTLINRQAELDLIETRLNNAQIKIFAICGPSGSGKSALALEYAHKRAGLSTKWFNGSRIEKFEHEYKCLANSIGVNIENKTNKYIIPRVNEKLSQYASEILFIVDNLEDYEPIHETYLSQLPKNIKLLITTQNELISDSRVETLQLGLFNREEAELYVKEHLSEVCVEAEEVNEIISLLEDEENKILPLNLKKLVFYCKEHPSMDIKKLIENIRAWSKDKMNSFLLCKLLERCKHSFLALQYCSYLDSTQIQTDLLARLLARYSSVQDEGLIQDSLDTLIRLSLVEKVNRTEIKMHALLQKELIELTDNNDGVLSELVASLDHLFEATNENRLNLAQNKPYYFHALSLVKYLDESGKLMDNGSQINKLKIASLINKLASYELYVNLDFKRNYSYNLKCYEVKKLVYDSEHPQLADSLYKLAISNSFLRDYNSSLYYDLKSYEMYKNLFDADNKLLADSLSNLAESFENIGEYEKAAEYAEQCCEMRKRLFGANHSKVADSLCSLAGIYAKQGELNKSLIYKIKSYEMRKFIFDDVHPEIADSLYSIGVGYESMGEYRKALDYFLECYELRKQLFEENEPHPHLADSLFSLANSYSYLGELDKSLGYDLMCLEMRKQIYDDDHPNIAHSIQNVALTYRKMGDFSNSLVYYLRFYDIKSKSLDKSHPCLIKLNDLIEFIKSNLTESNQSDSEN